MFAKVNRKVLISLVVLVLLLISGGVFYWQNQTDIRELNKKLPDGVRVEKSFSGNEYRVVNEIDGYEFIIPEAWNGINEIKYVSKSELENYITTTIEIEGKEGASRIITINCFWEARKLNLEDWARDNFVTFGLVGDFSDDKAGGIDVVKTQEEVHLLGMYVYFFEKDSKIYAIANGSEDFIREIISNGKW